MEKIKRYSLIFYTASLLLSSFVSYTDVDAQITPTHPRLILTSAKLDDLRAKACYDASGNVISGCTPQASWTNLKTWVDSNLNTTSGIGSTGACATSPNYDMLYSAVKHFALVYQITKITTYSDKVKSLLEDWYGCYDITIGPPYSNQYGPRGVGKNVAYGYDWVYDQLSADQISRFSTKMDSWITDIFAEPYAQDDVDHDYYYGFLIGVGSMAYAIYGDNANAQTNINTIKSRITNAIVPYLEGQSYTATLGTGYPIKKGTGLGPGGIWPAGVQYGDETFKALFDMFQILKSAESPAIDYFSTLNFPTQLPIAFIHQTLPNLTTTHPNGKMSRDPTAALSKYYRSWMAMLAYEYQGTPLSMQIQYWLNNSTFTPSNQQSIYFITDEFLWYDSTLPQENYNTLDPVYYSSGSQILIGRSGWTSNDTWFTFKSGGRWSTTNDNSQNHFDIYKYAFLAMDENNNSSAGTLDQFTSHNVIINNVQTTFQSAVRWLDDYGLAYWQGEATIPRREDTTNYSYIVGDATDVYVSQPGSGVTFNEREFLYIKDIDHFVIFDRYNTDGTPTQIWWYLHAASQPQVSGDTATITNGSGRLFVKTLLPASASIDSVNVVSTSWRLRVSPPSVGTQNQFLHVLYPTSTSTASMPDTVRVDADTGNMVGTHIKSSSRNYVVMFSSDPNGANVAGSITYTINPTVDMRHLIFDLPPNTAYNVDVTFYQGSQTQTITVTPVSGGSYISSSQGVLTFDSQVVPDSTPPVISGISSSAITSSSATISWTTDEPGDSQIQYGLTTGYGLSTTLDSTLSLSHSQNLTGLSAGTTYNFEVLSMDAAGNQAISGNNTFTTQAAPTTTTGLSISDIGVSSITSSSATITWTTNEAATSQVEYGITTAYGASSSSDTFDTSHSRPLISLASSTKYYFRVRSRDQAGNEVISGDNTFSTSSSTSPTPDTTPPGKVAGFSAIAGDAQIALSWTNPSDSDFIGVRIRFSANSFPSNINDGESLGDFTGQPNENKSWTHTNLQNGLTYYYAVFSYDGNGNFQEGVYAQATPSSGAPGDSGTGVSPSTSTNEDDHSWWGCGTIVPEGGNPGGPKQAADMLAIAGLLMLLLIRKAWRASRLLGSGT